MQGGLRRCLVSLQSSPVPVKVKPSLISSGGFNWACSKATKLDSNGAPVFILWTEFLFKRAFRVDRAGKLLLQPGAWPFLRAEASTHAQFRGHMHNDIAYAYGNYAYLLGEDQLYRIRNAVEKRRKVAVHWTGDIEVSWEGSVIIREKTWRRGGSTSLRSREKPTTLIRVPQNTRRRSLSQPSWCEWGSHWRAWVSSGRWEGMVQVHRLAVEPLELQECGPW